MIQDPKDSDGRCGAVTPRLAAFFSQRPLRWLTAAMILARADRELRDDAAVGERRGLKLDGLIEAAEGRTERLSDG